MTSRRHRSTLAAMTYPRRPTILLCLALAACAPAEPLPSPRDPPSAVQDPRIPFADPYRSDLIMAAISMMRGLKQQGGACLEARFLRVPAQQAQAVLPAYRGQLGGWAPATISAPPFDSVAAFRKDDAVFAVAVADRPQKGWTGVVIATNTVWSDSARETAAKCRAEG
ncbi:hypothetical protein FHS96_003213 [Sphingomonas zeicaulis]|uniref:hypothetical protein n=1 Tax=Sphingomonas zeicaulis TaxID=1632740 RepID=UPI003D1CCCAB